MTSCRAGSPSAGHESNVGAARGSRNGHGGIAAVRRAPLSAAAGVRCWVPGRRRCVAYGREDEDSDAGDSGLLRNDLAVLHDVHRRAVPARHLARLLGRAPQRAADCSRKRIRFDGARLCCHGPCSNKIGVSRELSYQKRREIPRLRLGMTGRARLRRNDRGALPAARNDRARPAARMTGARCLTRTLTAAREKTAASPRSHPVPADRCRCRRGCRRTRRGRRRG